MVLPLSILTKICILANIPSVVAIGPAVVQSVVNGFSVDVVEGVVSSGVVDVKGENVVKGSLVVVLFVVVVDVDEVSVVVDGVVDVKGVIVVLGSLVVVLVVVFIDVDEVVLDVYVTECLK